MAHIEVPETLHGAHDLVQKAFKELQSAPTGEDGCIVACGTTLAVNVAKDNLERALRIIDAVLKSLEQMGYEVAAGPAVQIVGVWVTFAVSEQLDVTREPADDEDLDDSRYAFRHNRFKEKSVPSGRLALQILQPACWSDGQRKTWSDATKQKLENVLSKFVAGLIRTAEHAKRDEEERHRRAEVERVEKLRREEEKRLRAEKRALIKAERERVAALFKQARRWRRSEDLRGYVEQVRQAHLAAHGTIPEESELARWITWALQQADRLDPSRESPPSILDEKVPDESEFQRKDQWW